MSFGPPLSKRSPSTRRKTTFSSSVTRRTITPLNSSPKAPQVDTWGRRNEILVNTHFILNSDYKKNEYNNSIPLQSGAVAHFNTNSPDYHDNGFSYSNYGPKQST
eukprot:Tbor_TRINITY_DN6873_c0_g1::TRINITY_DN6873_c0_g1_i1::g.7520::m.7520